MEYDFFLPSKSQLSNSSNLGINIFSKHIPRTARSLGCINMQMLYSNLTHSSQCSLHTETTKLI